jgi:hypothetical protein
MRQLLQLIAVVILFAACGEGGGPPSIAPRLDSNTNWLRYCSSDIPCGELSCACSICTLPCDPDACAALGPTARCARADEVELLAPSCGTAGITTSLCVAGCESDDDCAAGRACLLGNCIERIAGGEMAAAGSGTGAEGTTGAPPVCNSDCRVMANAAAQYCLTGGSMSDDDCMAAASEALDICATGCAGGDGDAAVTALYNGYRCNGDPVISTADATRQIALDNCRLHDLYNPAFGGMRCTFGDETIYDSCAGLAEGSSETAAESPAAVDVVSVAPATGVTCESDCRSFANEVAQACRSYGYGDDFCLASGQAQFDSCWEGCPAPEAPPLTGQP